MLQGLEGWREGDEWECGGVSLAGAATSIIFVAKNVLSQQAYFCTKLCLSRQKYACHDKFMFVATNTCLSRRT